MMTSLTSPKAAALHSPYCDSITTSHACRTVIWYSLPVSVSDNVYSDHDPKD